LEHKPSTRREAIPGYSANVCPVLVNLESVNAMARTIRLAPDPQHPTCKYQIVEESKSFNHSQLEFKAF
jgi:hypothetical protein